MTMPLWRSGPQRCAGTVCTALDVHHRANQGGLKKLHRPHPNSSPMKCTHAITAVGALLTAPVWAEPPAQPRAPSIPIEDAIATARRANLGDVVSVELECPDKDNCGYFVKTVDKGGHPHVFYAATRDAPTPVSNPADPAGQEPPPVAMEPVLRARTASFVTFGAGQIAGLGNVILDPLVQTGVSVKLSHPAYPEWDADAKLALVYGRIESTDPSTSRQTISKGALQEYRGQAHLIYNFHREGDIAKAGVGLYVDMDRSIRSFPRYIPRNSNTSYAAEEGEIAKSIFDVGVDFRFLLKQQLMSSEVHNVIFLSGSRIAPNLLTYKPMLGFMWSNTFSITGTTDQPGLSFLTDFDFYFARKAGVRYFNGHDGLGGTKRELDLALGLAYSMTPQTRLIVKSYGYNNLNRGASSTVPFGFKDGLGVTFLHAYE